MPDIRTIIVIAAIAYFLIVNIAALALMCTDKLKAKKGARRIPEKTLFLAVILGGGIGGTAGMYIFRHKTQHWYFAIGFPLITIIEAAAALLFLFL